MRIRDAACRYHAPGGEWFKRCFGRDAGIDAPRHTFEARAVIQFDERDTLTPRRERAHPRTVISLPTGKLKACLTVIICEFIPAKYRKTDWNVNHKFAYDRIEQDAEKSKFMRRQAQHEWNICNDFKAPTACLERAEGRTETTQFNQRTRATIHEHDFPPNFILLPLSIILCYSPNAPIRDVATLNLPVSRAQVRPYVDLVF